MWIFPAELQLKGEVEELCWIFLEELANMNEHGEQLSNDERTVIDREGCLFVYSEIKISNAC